MNKTMCKIKQILFELKVGALLDKGEFLYDDNFYNFRIENEKFEVFIRSEWRKANKGEFDFYLIKKQGE